MPHFMNEVASRITGMKAQLELGEMNASIDTLPRWSMIKLKLL